MERRWHPWMDDTESGSVWVDALSWLRLLEKTLSSRWPEELPHEQGPDFWFRAAQLEMSTRDRLSGSIRLILSGGDMPSLSPLEEWMLRRRFEWAGQLVLLKAEQGVVPPIGLAEVLEWLLVRSWESDGCIAMWNHAERGGKPDPRNPEGLSPW